MNLDSLWYLGVEMSSFSKLKSISMSTVGNLKFSATSIDCHMVKESVVKKVVGEMTLSASITSVTCHPASVAFIWS